MRINAAILLLTLCSLFCSLLSAQSLSNKGKEFWVGYGHHQFMEKQDGYKNKQEMVLYFSAEKAAHIIVTIHGTAYREEYDVPANSVIVSKPVPKGLESVPASIYDARLYTRPPGFPGGTGSGGIFKKHGIHIQSDEAIVTYAHIYGEDNSGATMLMPVETWGHSYVSLNTAQFYSAGFGSNSDCYSWMYVIAKENETKITVVPSVNTRDGRPANLPFDVVLQKGEIYQLLGANISTEEAMDVTGTTVKSVANANGQCFPVAVFSGSSRTQIACTGTNGSGDNLMQQIFPYQAWGKHYLTSPTSVDNAPKNHNINIFRILVKDPSTIVKKNGQQLFGLNGFYYEYQSDKADYIEADKPVMVAQYMPSKNACGYQGDGDPEMIIISPMEQAISHIGFYRNTRDNIKVNYLSLIIPTAGIASLKIDGQLNNTSDIYPHPNYAGYSVVVKRWVAAQQQCIVESDSGFTAITYGMGGAESYGYNAGAYINNLNGMPVLHNKYSPGTNANPYTCVNSPVQLAVLMRYKPVKMEWKMSELSGIVSPAADVVVNNPVHSAVEIIKGIPYYKYSLPGHYVFNQPGTHKISLLATSPLVETCNNTEPVLYEVEVKGRRSTDFSIIYNNCNISEQVFFKGNDTLNSGDSIKTWAWTFAGNSTGNGRYVSEIFNAGSYTVHLMAADSVGCIAGTTKTFSLVSKPATPVFDYSPAIICAGSNVQFKNTTPEAGIKKWLWYFGANDTLTALNDQPVSFSFLNAGTVQVKHVVKLSETCMSDTATATIVVNALPNVGFNAPEVVCMPVGKAVFSLKNSNSNNTVYNWAFGDGQTGSGVNPVHVYNAAGNYLVKLEAISGAGCRAADSVMLSNFKNRPLADFDISAVHICQGKGVVMRDKSSTDNGIVNAWNWNFGDGTNSARQHENKTYNYPGVYDVKLIVTNNAGCISDTVSKKVQVYLQPVIDAGVLLW